MASRDSAHPDIPKQGGAILTGGVEAPARGWEVPFLLQGGGDSRVGDRGSGDSGWPGANSGVKYGISDGFRVELEL